MPDFSPDGAALVTGGEDGVVRVWHVRDEDLLALADRRVTRDFTVREIETYADALDPTLVAASALVQSLLDDTPLLAEVVDRIASDTGLTPGIRRAALGRAGRLRDSPQRLNAAAWGVVARAELPPTEYARALRWATEAARMAPRDAEVLNTLGVAQYRCDRYEAAMATLAAAEKSRSPSNRALELVDRAVSAMCTYRLGRREEAEAELEHLRAFSVEHELDGHVELTPFLEELAALLARP